MGRILEYNSLGAAPADDDLLFLGDYSADNANPATKRLLISDLNKKRNVDAADGNGLKLRDDAQNIGLFIKDGGASGPVYVGVNTDSPSYNLDLKVTSADATFRIEAGTSNDAIIRFDQTGTQRASIGYDDTGDLLKLNNSSTFGSNNHLVIDTNGNVGVGTDSPGTLFDVSGGDIRVTHNDTSVSKQGGILLDASLRNIRGITYLGGDAELHLDRHSTGSIYFMRYADNTESPSNPVMYLDKDGRSVQIGNVNTNNAGEAKLWIIESGATKPVVRAENYVAGGSNVAGINIKRADSGNATNFYLNVGNDGYFNIGSSLANASSSSVNINTSGNLSIGATSFTYKFNSTSSSNIIGSFLMSEDATSSNNTGARILVESAALHTDASSVIAFPFTSGSRTTGWMCGNLRNSSTNYFGIYYSSGDPGTPSNVAFNNTLANNQVYITQAGDVNVKQDVKATRNVQGAAFYDIGGTTVGNYCRGRFIQTYSYRYFYAEANQRWTPLFSEPVDLTNNYNDGSTTPDKSMCSKAPMAGRVTRIDVSFTNSIANDGINAFVYSGADAPTADLSSSNAAYTNTISLGGAVTEGDYTIGYNDFVEASRTHLDFAAGEFLMLAIKNDTGNANATVVITVEFNVPDNLGD